MPTAMKNKSTAAEKIFVSLPSSFSMKWVGLILGKAQNLAIDARVYHGIPKSPPPLSNSAEYEARQEMYSSQAVFAAIAKRNNGEIDGDWIIKYLPRLNELAIEINLGLVEISIADFPESNRPLFPATPTIFPAAEKWLDYLFKELDKTR